MELIKHRFKGAFIPLAEPKQQPKQEKIIDRIKHALCIKNRKILKSYGIIKGQKVEVTNERLGLIKYHDKTMKQDRQIKLTTKALKKYFKEVY